MTAQAYPPQWPAGRPRSKRRESARFDTTLAAARDGLLDEIRLLGARNLVISSNLQLRNDGLLRAGQPEPRDPGIAIYFRHMGREMSFACDRWDRARDNMRGIEKTIGALRGIARWGTSDIIEAAFTGFLLLAAPSTKWWDVLGCEPHSPTAHVLNCYRQLRSEAHRACDTDRFAAVGAAYEQFQAERGLS